MKVRVYGFALVIKSANNVCENGNTRQFFGEEVDAPFEMNVDFEDGHNYYPDSAIFEHQGGSYKVAKEQCRVIQMTEKEITIDDCK